MQKLLEEKYGSQLVSGGGLNIYTTLDLDLQQMVQEKASEHIASLKERNIHNAAVVVMQPRTGQILAMVGSVDYDGVETTSTPGESGNVLDGQVNVAIRERQPGSSLKPFTYVAAMERGMTPATVLWDVPTEFPSGASWYAPRNYNGRWNGPVRIRAALANSLNMPAVKALKFAGIEYTLNFLDRVGIKEGLKHGPSYYGLSLTLGGGEVTLLELTTAYNTLASNGRYYPPTPILKITDNQGRELESFQQRPGQQAINPALDSIIVDIMSDDEARAPIWGRNSKLKLSRPAAVKTGTSEDWRDAWTLGFTPYVTVGVWSGNNNNEQTYKVESLQGGGIIWHNVLEEIFTWIDEKPAYRQLFSEPFPNKKLQEAFTVPEDGSVLRMPICSLPGAFGGRSEELFTRDMLPGTGVITPTQTSASGKGKIAGACDAYKRIRVVQLPQQKPVEGTEETEQPPSYCLPVEGQTYPPGMITEIYTWNFPDPDPGERVVYSWSGYSGGANVVSVHNIQFCTPEMFVTPTPLPTASPPPVAGAVQMPNLTGVGENQAKELLARLGVKNIYVDYQTRDRIPDIYDRFVPYAVVSSVPSAGQWIYPGSSVILGIRAPGDDTVVLPTTQPGTVVLTPQPETLQPGEDTTRENTPTEEQLSQPSSAAPAITETVPPVPMGTPMGEVPTLSPTATPLPVATPSSEMPSLAQPHN